ncbi:hypothetical protein GYMLUDRAFT_35916 [Collybiopsis luxurians FD-317 M1]|nr:hypothetical protein GYMLUDRAFT_35916 [Collybiopsis luxurians FD-317 M1]
MTEVAQNSRISQMKKAAEKDGWSADETFKMLELLSEPMIDSIYDFTAPSEWKKKNNKALVEDNQRKIIWDASKFLSSDPTRRFTFAFTIEGTALSLWLLHRGALLKGEPFKFIEDAYSLVEVFFAFAFASPEQMGWDPTIVPALINERGYRAFFIGISGRVYRTLETLSNHSAENPLGRAVRVRTVEDAHGQQHVLKDLWQETDRDEEHEIHNRILENVLHFAPGLRHLAQGGLFTILAHCHVEVSGRVDHTTNVILWGIDLRKAQTFEVEPEISASPESQSIDHSFIENLDIDKRGGIPERLVSKDLVSERVHYRILFEEYATTLFNETSLHHITLALTKIMKVLSIIHYAGWVHRDISVANLYFYQGRGIVGDWEYATSREDSKEHNVRAGTPLFMSCEAMAHAYLFFGIDKNTTFRDLRSPIPEELLPDSTEIELDQLFSRSPSSDDIISKADSALNPPFRYNSLHDLESVWWVILWVLLSNDDPCNRCMDVIARRNLLAQLFDGNMKSSARVHSHSSRHCQYADFIIHNTGSSSSQPY